MKARVKRKKTVNSNFLLVARPIASYVNASVGYSAIMIASQSKAFIYMYFKFCHLVQP